MKEELKGIKHLTARAPVSPLKPGDVDDEGNKVEKDNGFQVYYCYPSIAELSKPMTPDEYARKEKEIKDKYPGILS